MEIGGLIVEAPSRWLEIYNEWCSLPLFTNNSTFVVSSTIEINRYFFRLNCIYYFL